MPAWATAKSVIASAKRLIDVRHDWRSRSRIAEINVPAWPIPIHHTKLTIANPHPTGAFTPQTPIPRMKSTPIEKRSTIVSRNPIAKPTTQKSGVFRVMTIEEILSVTEPKV